MPVTQAGASVSYPLPEPLVQAAASLFALLSATVRLHLLWLLADGDHDVSSLADATGQTVATVSHHLGKLKLAGLVQSRRNGKRVIYVIDDPHVIEVVRLVIGKQLDVDAQHPRRRVRGG